MKARSASRQGKAELSPARASDIEVGQIDVKAGRLGVRMGRVWAVTKSPGRSLPHGKQNRFGLVRELCRFSLGLVLRHVALICYSIDQWSTFSAVFT
jgi:hypothetical protein